MTCFKPNEVWKTDTGKITFRESEGVSQSFKIPCGQCIGCRIEYSETWATRCMHEAAMHTENCSILLTYDDKNLATSLDPQDFTLFLKRLRTHLGRDEKKDEFGNKWRKINKPIKYFMCGEYGEKGGRPHIHALIFGYGFYKDRKYLKTTDAGTKLYRSAELEKLWGKGFAHVAEATRESAAYIARYVLKKIKGNDDYAKEHYETFDIYTGEITQLLPEFGRMSDNIGISWLRKYKRDYLNTGALKNHGKPIKLPRAYKKYLETYERAEYLGILDEILEKAEKHKDNNTPERLEVREKVLSNNLKFKQRSLT